MKKINFIFLVFTFCLQICAQVPNWYSSHSHPKYPNELYVVGVGTAGGTTGIESAKKAAIADIVAQLRVQIQSEIKTLTESFAVNDDEQIYSDFRRQSRTVVNDEITGAEVVETVVDATTQASYALVVLNRVQYSSAIGTELESGWKQASELREAAKDFAAKGKLNEAIQSINQIKGVLAPLYAKQVLYSAAARKPFSSPSIFNPVALQSDIRTFLSQVKLEKKSGDKQKGKIGEKFSQPFSVSVTINGIACAGITVQFFLEGKTLIGETLTDDKGVASFSTIVRSGNEIRAKLLLSGIGKEFDQNLTSSSVGFSWVAETSDKAFSVKVSAKNKKVEEQLQSKISSAVSQIGYKVVTMSNFALHAEINSGIPNKIEGMAGTLYNISIDVVVNLKENKTNAVLGSVKFSAKGVGKSEDEAVEKAANAIKIDQKELAELLQK